MSSNPYSPPDSPTSKEERRQEAFNFPYAAIGPKAWIAAALLKLIITVFGGKLPVRANQEEIVFVIISFGIFLTVAAIIYGGVYAWVLSLIFRRLDMIPRVRIHLRALLITATLTSFAGLPPELAVGTCTLVGGSVALLTAQREGNYLAQRN